MPLYLPDENIDDFCKEVAEALRAIRLHCADTAVTPAIALKMIKQYIQPLLPKKFHYLFYRQQVVTWNGIGDIYYSALDLYIKKYKIPIFLQVAGAINIIHRNTTKIPRNYAYLGIGLEIRYFVSMCHKLELPKQYMPRKKDEGIDVFSFCKLCWRGALPGRKLCVHHSTSQALQTNTVLTAARYKSGMRQKKGFYCAVADLLARDVFDFYVGQFTPDILFPSEGISEWLMKRRPLVWQLLADQQPIFNDINGVSILLDSLHNSDDLPSVVQRAYVQINQHLQTHPLLIWPMLLRAEGWLRSREDLRAKWGGKRIGAGRRG